MALYYVCVATRHWLRVLFWLGAIGAAMTLQAGEPAASSEGQARERIAALRTEIAGHDELYFKQAAPVISDAAYDRLKRELQELEAAWPELVRAATAQSGGGGDDRTGGFPVYRHRQRMLSLPKAYTEAELRAFDARVCGRLGIAEADYVVEPKFDGLAISVTYERGQLVRAVTRGNGAEGDDVTANARTIRALPASLRGIFPEAVEIRGEVFMGFEEFARINRERAEAGEEPYANPRNLAAGTLKLSDPREVAARRLEIVFYGHGAVEPAAARPESQLAWLAQLRAWGLPTMANPRPVLGVEAMWAAVRALGAERGGYAFPTDGAVIKVNETIMQEKLGVDEQAPKWAVAYKFLPERVETRLRAITWQVGRSGVLTPVAELEPVVVGGSTVARATLHNREEIGRRDLRIGDFVYLEKAGEIIPAITGVNLARRPAEARPYEFPVACPACAGTLQGGRCGNAECPAQVRRRLEHFAGASGVAIKGLGPALIEKLVASGRVKSPADLYRVRRDELLALEGVGAKSADGLWAAIERSKRAELARVIAALGIPQVGATGARTLAGRCADLGELVAIRAERPVEGVSRSLAQAVEDFFQVPANRILVTQLQELGVGAKP
jgi:DNA ligase (NAD+)